MVGGSQFRTLQLRQGIVAERKTIVSNSPVSPDAFMRATHPSDGLAASQIISRLQKFRKSPVSLLSGKFCGFGSLAWQEEVFAADSQIPKVSYPGQKPTFQAGASNNGNGKSKNNGNGFAHKENGFAQITNGASSNPVSVEKTNSVAPRRKQVVFQELHSDAVFIPPISLDGALSYLEYLYLRRLAKLKPGDLKFASSVKAYGTAFVEPIFSANLGLIGNHAVHGRFIKAVKKAAEYFASEMVKAQLDLAARFAEFDANKKSLLAQLEADNEEKKQAIRQHIESLGQVAAKKIERPILPDIKFLKKAIGSTTVGTALALVGKWVKDALQSIPIVRDIPPEFLGLGAVCASVASALSFLTFRLASRWRNTRLKIRLPLKQASMLEKEDAKLRKKREELESDYSRLKASCEAGFNSKCMELRDKMAKAYWRLSEYYSTGPSGQEKHGDSPIASKLPLWDVLETKASNLDALVQVE